MNVGDYVRTKCGNIFKIIGGNEDNWEIDIDYSILENSEDGWLELFRYNDNHCFFTDMNILKSSPNIIDLIEVGDYVNGMKIIDTSSQYYKLVTNLVDNNAKEGLKNVFINNEKDIKSIVTKEQFESMEYRL